jgi:hypothetical protein
MAIPQQPPRPVETGRMPDGDFPWRGQGRDVLEARRSECLVLLAETDGTLARITSHIENARGSGAANPRDADWWRRIQVAKRLHGARRQRLQEELGELRRAMAAESGRAQMFIRVARDLLGDERVSAIWLEVTRRLMDGETC